MRILGLDIGEKWIGVALSDPQRILAIPLTAVSRVEEKADLEAIIELVHQYEVEQIVVGLPYSLDGSLGKEAKRVQDFVTRLSQCVPIPVETWDERFSTLAAQRMITEAGVKRKKRKGRVDAMAATLILQSYLDRMRNARK